MKRLAWLLLALSLPAWATINGVDSSRVVLPSFDGTRYGAYVAGDYPETPPGVIWTQDFEGIANETVFSKANMDSTYEALEGLGHISICDAGVTISNTVARHGTQSVKFYNDLAVPADGSNCTDSARKARVEIQMGANQYKITHKSAYGDQLGFTFGDERWIGYSMYFPTAGNDGWTASSQPIIFQLIGAGAPTGDPTSPVLWMHLNTNGGFALNTGFSVEAGDLTSAQDYLFEGGNVYTTNWDAITSAQWTALKTSGSSGAEYHLKFKSAGYYSRDTWYDVIIHYKKGYTKATGLIEVWVRNVTTGVLTKMVDVPAFPTTVSDFSQSYFKTGIYKGVQTVSNKYTMYIDSWRAYDEQGTFNAVDPAQDD